MNFAIWEAAASLYISVMIKLCGTNWTKYIDGLVQERRNPISNAWYLEYAICAASLHIRSQSMYRVHYHKILDNISHIFLQAEWKMMPDIYQNYLKY